MESLYTTTGNAKLIDRINTLTSSTPAKWGKMRVDQMLAHCQAPFKVAFGEMKLKRGLIGLLFGGMAKKQLTAPEPFKPNLPTHPMFKISDERVFNSEKEKLVQYIKQFSSPSAIKLDVHPFFGKLTAQEWDLLMYKHLDHHLRQFGA